MRAGLRIVGPHPCTSGFSARGGSGRSFMLTAGHCGTGVFRNGGAIYGSTDRNLYEESIDYDVQRIVRTNSSWSHSWYIFLNANDFRRIDSTIPNNQITVGTQVGQTGNGTGTTRGNVRMLNVGKPIVGGPRVYVAADYCSSNGDSGGGVFRNNTAWGLHVTSTARGGGVSDCNNQHFRSYFLPIRTAASSLNVTIVHP